MTPFLPPRTADPTLEAFRWDDLRGASAFRASPAYVIASRWSDAGKIAVALGPRVPVFVVSPDPRGWAFLHSRPDLVGQDGILVVPRGDLALARQILAPLFKHMGEPEPYALIRNGVVVAEMALVPVQGLTEPLPLPYRRP
jgi:hypothetical protein